MTGGRRRVHNEELYNLYSSPSVIRIIKSWNEMGKACSTNGGEEEGIYIVTCFATEDAIRIVNWFI
jgi:hypothetical protein